MKPSVPILHRSCWASTNSRLPMPSEHSLAMITVPPGFSLTSTTCGAQVLAGTGCSFTVTFSPTAAVAYSGSLQVASNNPTALAVSLTGTGTPAGGPTAPQNLQATFLTGPNRVALTWTDASNNENLFQVWRATGATGGTFTQIGTVNRSNAQRTSTGGTVTFTNTTNLTVGATYRYYVIAVNTAPNPDVPSVPSNTATVTLTVPLPPAAPTGLAGSAVRITGNIFQDRVTLNWTDNSNNETGFEIQRSTNQNFNGPSVTSFTVGANVTTFQQNVVRTSDFYYRVRATNAAGGSAWSTATFVITP